MSWASLRPVAICAHMVAAFPSFVLGLLDTFAHTWMLQKNPKSHTGGYVCYLVFQFHFKVTIREFPKLIETCCTAAVAKSCQSVYS